VSPQARHNPALRFNSDPTVGFSQKLSVAVGLQLACARQKKSAGKRSNCLVTRHWSDLTFKKRSHVAKNDFTPVLGKVNVFSLAEGLE
jgi:hypothetical protein